MATIYDVAQKAGVSHTAVSSVINGKRDQVGPETWERIVKVIDELGYKPSRVARQLATGCFNTIGICFERPFQHVFLNPFNTSVIAGIGETTSQNAYSLLIAPITNGYRFSKTIENLSSQGIDGAIIVGPISQEKTTLRAIDRSKVPIVCIDSYSQFAHASTVDIDNYSGMKKGVEHLLKEGHRHLLYLGQKPMFQCQYERLQAFLDALKEFGIEDPNSCVRTFPYTETMEQLRRALHSEEIPTAIVCGDGAFGAEVCLALRLYRIRIPEEISVLTFDDPSAGDFISNSINIVRPIPYEMGTAAAGLLQKMLAGKCKTPQHIRLSVKVELHPSPIPIKKIGI